MVGWARRQRIADEREDIELRKGRAELESLTDQERAEKLERDTQDSAGLPDDAASVPIEADGSIANESEQVPYLRRSGLASIRASVATLDTALIQKLRFMYGTANIDHGARVILPDNRAVEIDAVAYNPADSSRQLFELKYSSSSKNVINQIISGLSRLHGRPSAMSGIGALVVVVPDDAEDSLVSEWSVAAQTMAGRYKSDIRTLVMRYSDFIELPAWKFLGLVEIEVGTLFG